MADLEETSAIIGAMLRPVAQGACYSRVAASAPVSSEEVTASKLGMASLRQSEHDGRTPGRTMCTYVAFVRAFVGIYFPNER